MTDISMREMLEAGVHFGHQTRNWNPKMAAYLYGHRNKIHIIDLEKTKAMFQEALNFVGKLSANKGRILFVGTKRAAQQIIREEARRCEMPYINLRWLGGLLTNYKTVKKSINRLRELEEMKTDGSMERMNKKEVLHHQRELEKLERNLAGIKDMEGWPDALFVVDVGYEDIAVSEAVKLKIPVVGVVDSNNSPVGVDYVIPGNDDAIRSIRLYTKAIADAIITGKDSVAHLGDGGDKDEFVELDAEGAPIVETKREKVEVKKKTTRKSSRKTEPSATGGGEEAEAVAKPKAKPEQEAVEPAGAEPVVTDGGEEAETAAKPEPQPEEKATTKSKTQAGGSESSRDRAIYECVRQVPKGKVATYGRIAELVGAGCWSQQVGAALRRLSEDTDVPWQRIIGSKGEVKPRSGQKGEMEQRRLLEQEGVALSDSDKVDLVQYGMSVTDFKSVPKNTTDAEQD
jgi:small subunit ribosomal protein S2